MDKRLSAMTSILWHYSVLNRGGAELSTLRLLKGLAKRGATPLLALNLPGGAAEADIGSAIAVRHLRDPAPPRTPRRTGAAPARAANLAVRYALARSRQYLAERRLGRTMRFDAAVVGLQGLSPAFVCRRVRAVRRLHFIRNDLAVCDPTGRTARAIKKYRGQIDAYVCVSEAARQSLIALDPALADKAHTIPNLLCADEMRAKAQRPDPYPPRQGGLRVLTVARLSERPKALTRMVKVHAGLLRAGYDFDWFILGEGPDEARVKAAIDEAGIGARMHLLGGAANPFPYYRHADIVAVLSRYEGLCGAINEAKVMERPVIATDVGAAREQLGSGGGLIVADCETDIAEGLARLLRDGALRSAISNVPLPAHLFDDEAKLDRMMALFAPERG